MEPHVSGTLRNSTFRPDVPPSKIKAPMFCETLVVYR